MGKFKERRAKKKEQKAVIKSKKQENKLDFSKQEREQKYLNWLKRRENKLNKDETNETKERGKFLNGLLGFLNPNSNENFNINDAGDMVQSVTDTVGGVKSLGSREDNDDRTENENQNKPKSKIGGLISDVRDTFSNANEVTEEANKTLKIVKFGLIGGISITVLVLLIKLFKNKKKIR